MEVVTHNDKKTEQGFTLIELSIVLVIIGLIVGGVLVGQDLIKASEIRATVGQVEKYNSAVNTFRTKYNGLPGDLPQTTAGAFGLFAMTATGVAFGDGNGLVEGGATGAVVPVGETIVFWRHMSDANLVDGQLGTTGNSLVTAAGGTTGAVTTINQSLPDSRTSPTNSFAVYANSGLNYYQLMPLTGITAGAYTAGTTGMTPIQSFNMDTKLDDGLPVTGIVQAKGIGVTPNAVPSFNNGTLANRCINGTSATDTTATYNRVEASGGNDGSCSVRFRFN
ncbi:MAG: prepilin-type N-terminal cleavage/methylation domain-containing protein [Rickettsiales bacterium]|nr:prepilin-type N-terminal cleavage/methylation domain-containing protein [Rickettsiales bacterium]